MSDSTRRRPAWLRWSGNILLILFLVWAVQWWQSRGLAGGPAPELSAFDLDGAPLSLDHYRGQTVLVHFWATWCPICRLEEKGIDRLSRDYPVITVATNSGSPAELRTYLDSEALSFAVIPDEGGEVASRWRVRGVPVSYIVDPAGEIVWSGAGYTSEWGLRARLQLAQWGFSLPL